MQIIPLHDRLVVRQFKETVSRGGIYTGELVDDGLVKELVTGEVIAVGPGLKTKAGKRDSMWDLAPGMVVKFSPVCSIPVAGTPEYVVIRRDAVAGVVA